MNRLLVALVMVVLCSPAASVTWTSYGGGDCGQWVNESASRAYYRNWLAGYMSGLASGNNRAGNNVDVLDAASMDAVVVWMDNYCQKNPLERLPAAGLVLFDELYAREKSKR